MTENAYFLAEQGLQEYNPNIASDEQTVVTDEEQKRQTGFAIMDKSKAREIQQKGGLVSGARRSAAAQAKSK